MDRQTNDVIGNAPTLKTDWFGGEFYHSTNGTRRTINHEKKQIDVLLFVHHPSIKFVAFPTPTNAKILASRLTPPRPSQRLAELE